MRWVTDVAFATYHDQPHMTEDDRLAAGVLLRKGVSAVWNDPEVDWSRFTCVVIRSTRDYHHKPTQYAEWLRSRQAAGKNLWNPARAVLVKVDKRYLVEFANRGVDVVPTAYPAAR